MEISTILLLAKIVLYMSTILFLIFLFFMGCSFYALFKTKIPCVNSPIKNIEIIFKKLNLKNGLRFYDLGCGEGKILFLAEKYGLRAIGYELSLVPYLLGRIKKKITKSNIKIERKDFLKQDLKDADVVFMYLTNVIFEKLIKKLEKELKQGAIVISYSFEIKGWKPYKIIDTSPSKTYIYKICTTN